MNAKTDIASRIISLSDDKIRELYTDLDNLLKHGIERAEAEGKTDDVEQLRARRKKMENAASDAIALKRAVQNSVATGDLSPPPFLLRVKPQAVPPLGPPVLSD